MKIVSGHAHAQGITADSISDSCLKRDLFASFARETIFRQCVTSLNRYYSLRSTLLWRQLHVRGFGILRRFVRFHLLSSPWDSVLMAL